MEGNEEADKLATLGVNLHEVPPHLAKAVDRQDALVEDLLRMMLSIMDHVHDKAPPRTKKRSSPRKRTGGSSKDPKLGLMEGMSSSVGKKVGGGAQSAPNTQLRISGGSG
eukprot:9986624-Heterocapsa_arctica.AAC.1